MKSCASLLVLLLLCLPCAAPCPARADDPVLMNNYGLELLQKGEEDRALEQFRKANGYFPYDPVIKKNLAMAHARVAKKKMHRNDFAGAVDDLERALELTPDERPFLVLKGIASYYLKRYDIARENLERGMPESGEEQRDALYYLGWVSYDTDDLAKALECWEKAQALQPDSQELKRLIAKVKRELAVEPGMDKGYSSRFMVSYDAEVKSSLAEAVLYELESAYNRAGADLDYFPAGGVAVALYTAKDFRGVTQVPEWSGGVYDGKIRLPIGGVDEMTPHLRAVLHHEYAHVVVFGITNGNCPTWLNEGIAELQGRRELNPSPHLLDRAAREGRLIPWQSLEGPFVSFGTQQAALAYEESYAAVRYLVETYGWHKVKQVLVNLGSGMAVQQAFATAFDDYGLDYPALEREWRASLPTEN
jgi:tetratricopeptide (TPR) repeat protein